MNFNRYKVKFPKPDVGARPLEFAGTWIVFGGIILFAVLLGIEGYRGNEGMHAFPYVVGGMYAISWFSARSKWVLLLFVLLTFFIPLIALQFSVTNNGKCASVEPDTFFQHCRSYTDLIIVYSIYVFSIFLVVFYGLFKKSKVAD